MLRKGQGGDENVWRKRWWGEDGEVTGQGRAVVRRVSKRKWNVVSPRGEVNYVKGEWRLIVFCTLKTASRNICKTSFSEARFSYFFFVSKLLLNDGYVITEVQNTSYLKISPLSFQHTVWCFQRMFGAVAGCPALPRRHATVPGSWTASPRFKRILSNGMNFQLKLLEYRHSVHSAQKSMEINQNWKCKEYSIVINIRL